MVACEPNRLDADQTGRAGDVGTKPRPLRFSTATGEAATSIGRCWRLALLPAGRAFFAPGKSRLERHCALYAGCLQGREWIDLARRGTPFTPRVLTRRSAHCSLLKDF